LDRPLWDIVSIYSTGVRGCGRD